MGKLIGISQKSAWKLGHAIRKMMDPGSELVPALSGIVELDEKYIGGKPRYEKGVVHKGGKALPNNESLLPSNATARCGRHR